MADGEGFGKIVKFLSLYSRLKDWCDDDPDATFQLAVADTQFKELCMQVLGAAERLHASEQRHRHLFAADLIEKAIGLLMTMSP